MQTFLDNIKNNFPQYKNAVDALYATDSEPWSHVFETINSKTQLPFYQAVFSVIRHFLNDDVRNQDVVPDQLFIQLPMEELGRTDSLQRQNLNNLHEIVASAILYSTAAKLRQNTECLGMNHTSEGEFYYTKSKNQTGNCWQIMPSIQSKSGLRPKLLGFSYGTSDAIALFNKNSHSTIRIISNPIVDSAHTTTANKKSIDRCYNSVRRFSRPGLQFQRQYCSARIIGYPDSWCAKGTLIENEFIDSPVRFYKNLPQVQDDTDIWVLIGDRKYKNFERRINNALADNRIKKVIYIGSSIFEGYDHDPRNVRYSFSFRELFTYFYGKYPDIKFHKFDFPWLFESLSQLRDILIETGVYEEDHKSIITIIAYRFLGLDFSCISPDFSQSMKERLLNEFGVSEDLLDSWLDNLSYRSSKTPKTIIKDQIFRNSPGFVVSDKKKAISEYLKHSCNKHNQKVMIDVRGDWRGYLEIIESLLSQSIFGEYNICTYTDLPHIQAFFEKEPEVYNNQYRVNMLKGQTFQISAISSNLADYFDPNMLDCLLQQDSITSAKRITFKLTAKNGAVVETGGDVIYGDNTKPLSEILEEKDDIFPTELTYYVQPNNYTQLMELYFNLPQGENVAYYAGLWKTKLREYCDSYYSGNIKMMAKQDFPFMTQQFKTARYINKDNPVIFPDAMLRLAVQMHRKEIISKREQNMLIAAYNCNKQNQSLGRTLKEALYKYRLHGRKDPILTTIEKNANDRGMQIDADSISSSALVTNSFINIEKAK